MKRSEYSPKELRVRAVNQVVDLLDEFIERMPAQFDRRLFLELRNRTFSQAEWAAAAGVAQGTIGNWERGYTSPTGTYRHSLKRAAVMLRGAFIARHTDDLASSHSLFDPIATSDQLQKSILRAALTDFEFDSTSNQIIPVPFASDCVKSNIQEIEADRENLIASLVQQADSLLEDLDSGANAPTGKVRKYLERYKSAAEQGAPNPRLLNRFGQIISRSINEEDFSSALNDVDNAALQGFASDHMELMRLYFREALARSQEIEASEISDETEIDDGTQFVEIATLMDKAQAETGAPLVNKDIPTILRDIAQEMRDISDAIAFSVDPARLKVLSRRRAQAFKTGSVYVGRFVFFGALMSAVSDGGVMSISGSLASILGVIEVAVPGTIRGQYEKLRQRFPILPALPEVKSEKS
ncbi:helix-turn-helix domain-containing protein [Phaeobacter sp. BS52]|uniref:helix-turn-helix domain-containing protein n=1 Tax=Phaeobacter sp. BS52 TaxID=2907241 RepID=UPI003864B861